MGNPRRQYGLRPWKSTVEFPILSQIVLANLAEWARGVVSLEEMDARNEYGLALVLLAIATQRSRRLDDDTRGLLAKQLTHLTRDQEAS